MFLLHNVAAFRHSPLAYLFVSQTFFFFHIFYFSEIGFDYHSAKRQLQTLSPGSKYTIVLHSVVYVCVPSNSLWRSLCARLSVCVCVQFRRFIVIVKSFRFEKRKKKGCAADKANLCELTSCQWQTLPATQVR